uniref:Reverse transcriptase domain-containing protein n=1 Tax=Tanacetum cinerariifolium TaxID=118510 RepID=A0A699HC76_TANCI|nr:hypothetical protein [Tanacetum cinerariifolium]
MFIQPHDLNFIPEPIYPEYIPLEDEHILPAEEQPLPPVVSPTAESPGYVAESDPEEDPEEYEDNETEDDDAEDEEKAEHLALADSAVVIPTDELVSPPEGTEPIIPPPSTDTATTGARITIRLQAAISFPPEVEVERLLAMPTPSPSLLTLLSPPSAGEHLARCMALIALPSPPLPPHLHMPPPVDCSRYEVGESSTARPTRGRGIDYGFVSTLDAEMQQTEISELQETDHRHQAQMAKTLRMMGDMRREMGDMQAELLALRGKLRRAGQPGGDARVPNHQDASRDADSHI